MSSTLVLIALMLSLSIAVVFPELQYSKTNKKYESVDLRMLFQFGNSFFWESAGTPQLTRFDPSRQTSMIAARMGP